MVTFKQGEEVEMRRDYEHAPIGTPVKMDKGNGPNNMIRVRTPESKKDANDGKLIWVLPEDMAPKGHHEETPVSHSSGSPPSAPSLAVAPKPKPIGS